MKLCECGCGEPTPLAKRTSSRYGHVRGEPLRFINGHNARKRRDWTVVDAGYETPCWWWNGTLTTENYGVLRENYVQIKAHRWVYERLRGPLPGGLVIDHLCRNKCCVNPDHLDVVTGSENSKRHWALQRVIRR